MATANSNVTYKDVPGFPGYRVGDDGSVWSCRGNRGRGGTLWFRLKPQPTVKSGHLQVDLYPADPSEPAARRLVHRLVLEAFVGPCPEGMECCHFPDRDPANNRLGNLRWDTNSANKADRIVHGTDWRGEQAGTAKLTTLEVLLIRHEWSRPNRPTQFELADRFGVAQPTISEIVSGRKWAHLTGNEIDPETFAKVVIATAMDAAYAEVAALPEAAQARVSAWFRSRYGSPPDVAPTSAEDQ